MAFLPFSSLRRAGGAVCAPRVFPGFEVSAAAAPPEPSPPDEKVNQAQRAEEESMLAEAGNDHTESPRRDPEEAALELLQNELGARRIDGS